MYMNKRYTYIDKSLASSWWSGYEQVRITLGPKVTVCEVSALKSDLDHNLLPLI